MNSEPEIYCTRCDSTVAWAPFCARCGAYLEFVGRPPWQPDEPESLPGSGPAVEEIVGTTVVETVVVGENAPGEPERSLSEEDFAHLYSADESTADVDDGRGSAMISAAVVGVLVIGVIGGLGLTFLTNGWIGGVFALMCLTWGIVLIPRKRATSGPVQPRGQRQGAGFVAVAGVVLLGVAGGVGLWFLTNEWIAGMFALVCLAWAVALWPRRGVPLEPVPEPESEPAVEEVTEVLVAESILTEAIVEEEVATPDVPRVEARAPQVVPTRAIEVPIPQATYAVRGDVPCGVCGELNIQGRHFCAWCGAVMPDMLVEPTTVPHLEQLDESSSESDSRGRSPRLSRSWRAPILAGTLAFVFLSAVILAVFGPFAFQVRLGTTQLFQAINQFIDPYAGNQADIVAATASTTLRGTSPRAGVGNDAADFWASVPSESYGAGNSLTTTFDRQYSINRAVVMPGIQNGLFSILALATPATVTLIFDDGSTITQILDKVQERNDTRQLIRFPTKTTQSVTMRIDTVYLPRNTNKIGISEVAVSGMYFLEPPRPPSIISVPTEVRQNPALPGTTN